jgi:hypothetical protein
MKPIKKTFYKGRRSSGFGQRQIFSEEYSHACALFGKSFVDSHIEAYTEGRTKTTLKQLIQKNQKK